MPFWDDLSPGVKRYAIVAAVLLAALFAFRHCGGPSTNAPMPSRSGR
jgi:hypothetical protein